MRNPSREVAYRVVGARRATEGRVTTVFIDAIEYAGDDVPAGVGGVRRPVRHHAFDTTTSRLAHGPEPVRVGFLDPARSWTAVPARARLCPACSAFVTDVVDERIRRQLSALLDRRSPIEKGRP